MELHDHPFSPYAFKVRAALYEKGIPFEKREVRRRADREALLRLNPRGEVPALVDGDAVICDSKVICAYLEDRFPDPALVPRDPVERARCRQLELRSDTDVDACVLVLGILRLMRPELASEVPGALPKAELALRRHQAALERELAGREWFLGSFSLVDIALTPHLRTAAFMGYPPAPEHPGLAAWLERGARRPSLRQAMREFAEGAAASQEPDSIFDPMRLHWRSDRLEFAVRVGLGPWLLAELAADRAFLSPLP
jgi:glutathione S-transferase/RNA polymerase-associated protein